MQGEDKVEMNGEIMSQRRGIFRPFGMVSEINQKNPCRRLITDKHERTSGTDWTNEGVLVTEEAQCLCKSTWIQD